MSEFDINKDEYISETSEEMQDDNTQPCDDLKLDCVDNDSVESVEELCDDNEDVYTEECDEFEPEYENDEFEDEEFIEEVDDKSGIFSGLGYYIAEKILEFNKLRRKQKITYVSVFFAILTLIILVMTDIIPILPNSYHRSYVGNEYTLGETIGSDAKKFDKYIIYASNGSAIIFGPDMKAEKKISTFQGVPIINTYGDKGIIYSKNGNSALVMKSKDDYKIVTIDENIYSAKVNSDGDYVLLTSESGYKSCVSAYSSSHKLIYDWHTNSNVIDVCLSNNESNIVASTIEYTDSAINSKLIFIETDSINPVEEIVIENTVISEVFFTNDNILIAFGDTATYGYTSSGIKKWEITYDGKNLKTYDVDDDGTLAFLFNKYNSDLSESTIEMYNSSGRKRGVYNSEKNVRSINVNNGHCLLQLDKGTILLDDDADAKKIKNLKEDYQTIVLYENYNFAFGVRDNISAVLSVNH